MNIALILAGGTGMRLSADMPKQYIEVGGKPIIAYCLETFEQNKDIDEIRIVADVSWHDYIRAWTGSKFRGISKPGETRQLSVFQGLCDMEKDTGADDVVIIHDAARPLVSDKLISDCLAACNRHEGAMPFLPMKDTVYLGDGTTITGLLDRSRVYAGQAPEAFVFGAYFEANKRLLPTQIREINGSAEPAVLAGMDIALLPGDEMNFKITTDEDLRRFLRLKEGQK